MRKPRDYDAELRALDDKARQLKERKVRQLGELVVACGGDALTIEQLAGLLLSAADTEDLIKKEEWRTRGARFFQGTRRAGGRTRPGARGAAANERGAEPGARKAGAS